MIKACHLVSFCSSAVPRTDLPRWPGKEVLNPFGETEKKNDLLFSTCFGEELKGLRIDDAKRLLQQPSETLTQGVKSWDRVNSS